MTALGLAVRWAHLASSVALVGVFAALLFAGRSDRPTARRWEAGLVGWGRILAALALAAGVAMLVLQTALLEGRASAALEIRPLLRVLLETQGGAVWLVRHGLIVLLAVFLALRMDLDRSVDWRAARGEAIGLGVVALGSLGFAGHAAAVQPGTALALAADVIHLVATGLWVGGLVPLAALLRAAAREDGADARPYAVVAARRFSRVALAAVGVLLLTGIVNALIHIGSVAGLVGTRYGRLLLLKLAILAPILVLGAANRRRLVPALSGEAATVGRPTMRRLGGFVAVEALLALALLGVVAVMGVTPPARHQQPTWPFSFRLSPVALADAPALRARALVGSQVAVLGAVALVVAIVLRPARKPAGAGAMVLLALGLGIAIPPLAIDAYPTTYRRPAVSYQAASIASGQSLYREHCAACHGASGAGDGPRARDLPRRPADLRAPHTSQHTAGDLFWWITNGISPAGMPGFAGRLGVDERWDLVNYLRASEAAERARRLGPVVEPGRPWLVAPDFTFAVGPTPPRALKDYRGRGLVLLVLYTLPASRPRLDALAERHAVLAPLGVEIIAAPTDGAPDAIRRLAAGPPILFPVVTEGAAEIVETYGLFAAAPHAEFLIDRQGYLRTRWATGEAPVRDPGLLLADVTRLNAEKPTTAAPAEHVH